MEIAVAVLLALLVAVVTLAVCDLAGGIARDKGWSYWGFFAFGLLLWFPSLITALALPDRSGATTAVRGPARAESVAAVVLLVLAVAAVAVAVWAALAYAP